MPQIQTRQIQTRQMLRSLPIPELVAVGLADSPRAFGQGWVQMLGSDAGFRCWRSIRRCAEIEPKTSGHLGVLTAVGTLCLFKNVSLIFSDASAETRKHL